MRKILAALLLAALSFTASAEVWQARYGVAETFNFKLFNADGTLDVDEADGGTEVSLSCNEGAETTATNDFVDEGNFYSIALTAAELQCERIAVVVAATTTEAFFIQTHSNASAMTPVVDANAAQLGGTTQTGRDIGTSVLISSGTGTGQLSVTSGVISADATQVSGDSAAADAFEAAFDGTATGARIFGIDRLGTAQSATTSTLVVDSGAAYGDNTLVGATAVACGSTQGYCQSMPVASNVGSTDTLTINGTWPVTPSGTISFQIWMTAPGSGGGGDILTIEGTDATTYLESLDNPTLAALVDIENQTDDIGVAGAGLTAADDAVIALIGVAGAGLTAVDDAVLARLPTALISGRMASQVGGYESGQAPLQPTVAGRTLDVTPTGSAGIDWANVENPTTALGLTGTTFSLTQAVASVSGAVGSVTAGVTVTTNNDKTGYALSAAGVDAIWDEPQSGHVTADTFGAYLDSSVSGVSTGGVSVGDIADAVWDEALLGHTANGSAGDALTDAATSSVGTGTGLTSIPWNPSWDAEVQSEAEDAIGAQLEQAARADAAILNCEVNTANFAGSTTTVACVLTDRDSGAITAASGDLEGRELLIVSGAQIYEGRFINDTTWDGVSSELRLTLSRALPATLADAVTAIIR